MRNVKQRPAWTSREHNHRGDKMIGKRRGRTLPGDGEGGAGHLVRETRDVNGGAQGHSVPEGDQLWSI